MTVSNGFRRFVTKLWRDCWRIPAGLWRDRRHLLWLPVILLATLWMDAAGLFQGVQQAVSQSRMTLWERPASKDIVFLTLDPNGAETTRNGQWSPASIAEIIERLVDAEVSDIAVDLDLTDISTADQDLALAKALDLPRKPVILPVFVQHSSWRHDENAESVFPIAVLRERARLALVDILPDRNGMIGRIPFEERVRGETYVSLPVALAGVRPIAGADVVIDFSIAAASVPTFPASALIEGHIGTEELRDRTVLIGTLWDAPRNMFGVPAQGRMSGSMIQILAAETLLQNRSLRSPPPLPFLIGLSMVLLLLNLRRMSLFGFVFIIGLSVSVAILGNIVQASFAIDLPTVAMQCLIVFYGLVRSVHLLTASRLSLARTRTDLSNTRALLNDIVSDSSEAIIVVDENGQVLEMSNKVPEIFGFEASFSRPVNLFRVAPLELSYGIRNRIAIMKNEGRFSASDGCPERLPLGSGRYIEYTITPLRLSGPRRTEDWYVACIRAQDLTEKTRQTERLQYMSRFDELTGAMRRGAFLTQLSGELIKPTEGSARRQMVFALGIHRLKTINSTLGWAVGDALLKAIVSRLNSSGLKMSPVARIEGDVFALYTRRAVTLGEAHAIGWRLADIVSAPYKLKEATAQIGVRIGISKVPTEAAQPAASGLAQAELALDEARSTGGSGAVVFDPVSSAKQKRARAIERHLWSALDNGEFYLVYQPIFHLSAHRIVSAQALMRWTHPTLGSVSADEFTTIAEANGFIAKLGRWVLRQACHDAMSWHPDVTVSIRVTQLQFLRGDLVEDVKTTLRKSGLPGRRLCLNIDESIVDNSSDELLMTLRQLRLLGVRFELDGFGTGLSAYHRLSAFPLDSIKLDSTLLENLTADSPSFAIIPSIKTLADGLGLTLACNGISNKEQLAIMLHNGCELGQGSFLAVPRLTHDIARMIESNRIVVDRNHLQILRS